MGLVSLFFALKGIMKMFRFLKHGVCFILLFIGVKMLLGFFEPVAEFFQSYSWVSLAVIIFTLAFSIVLSMLISDEKKIVELRERIADEKKANEELKEEK
jgi:tellurite resistance protein TerC